MCHIFLVLCVTVILDCALDIVECCVVETLVSFLFLWRVLVFLTWQVITWFDFQTEKSASPTATQISVHFFFFFLVLMHGLETCRIYPQSLGFSFSGSLIFRVTCHFPTAVIPWVVFWFVKPGRPQGFYWTSMFCL